MNRREFLSKTATVAAAGTIAGVVAACDTAPASPAPTTAQAATTPAAGTTPGGGPTSQGAQNLPTLDWQMATSWPISLDTLFGGAQYFAERVAALTDGKFKITPRAGGELAPATQVLDVVQQGAVP